MKATSTYKDLIECGYKTFVNKDSLVHNSNRIYKRFNKDTTFLFELNESGEQLQMFELSDSQIIELYNEIMRTK